VGFFLCYPPCDRMTCSGSSCLRLVSHGSLFPVWSSCSKRFPYRPRAFSRSLRDFFFLRVFDHPDIRLTNLFLEALVMTPLFPASGWHDLLRHRRPFRTAIYCFPSDSCHCPVLTAARNFFSKINPLACEEPCTFLPFSVKE